MSPPFESMTISVLYNCEINIIIEKIDYFRRYPQLSFGFRYYQ
jgi:hypothetical protein